MQAYGIVPVGRVIHHAVEEIVLEAGDGGQLSEEQERCIGELLDQGFTVSLAYSAAEAIAVTKEFFGI